MLLNTDNKIVTKMITNHLKPFLYKVISTDQSSYVPGRFIGYNIHKLLDMYLEREEIPVVLIVIDYKKCFDLVDHTALVKALQYF